MGAQLAGGTERHKAWMVDRDRTFVQVPFPDGYKNENISFDLFLKTLAEKGVQATRHRRRDDARPIKAAARISSPLITRRNCKASAASTTL